MTCHFISLMAPRTLANLVTRLCISTRWYVVHKVSDAVKGLMSDRASIEGRDRLVLGLPYLP